MVFFLHFHEIIPNCIRHARALGLFTVPICTYFVFLVLQVVEISWFPAVLALLLRVSPHGLPS